MKRFHSGERVGLNVVEISSPVHASVVEFFFEQVFKIRDFVA